MKLLFSLVILFTSSVALSADYYVDFVGGADTNNGTAIGTAFKHSPGDDNATDTAGSTTLAAGDTVYFKGGVVYQGTIDIDWGGSVGSVITYDGNSTGTWGTGKAEIDGEETRDYGFHAASSRNYITINNFEIYDLQNVTSRSGIAFVSSSTNTGITVKNCYLHNIGYWNNDTSDAATGSGITIYRPVDCDINNNELTKVGKVGIFLSGGSGSTISYNTIYDYIVWGIRLNGDRGAPNDVTISHNTIYDLYKHDLGFGSADGSEHTDFIIIDQASGDRPYNITIEHNLFYNNYTFTDIQGTAMIFFSYADDSIVRYNTFINPHSYPTVSASWGSHGIEITNNTFYTPRSGLYAYKLISLTYDGDYTITDNVFYTATALYWETDHDSLTGSTIDNNHYYFSTPTQAYKYGGTYYTFATFQSTYSKEASSTSHSALADIKFVDDSGYPTDCASMDLSLESDSPACGAGAYPCSSGSSGSLVSGTGSFQSGTGSLQ